MPIRSQCKVAQEAGQCQAPVRAVRHFAQLMFATLGRKVVQGWPDAVGTTLLSCCKHLNPLRWRSLLSTSILPGHIITLLARTKQHSLRPPQRQLRAPSISARTGHRRNALNACHSAEVSPKASSPDFEMLSANYQGCG